MRFILENMAHIDRLGIYPHPVNLNEISGMSARVGTHTIDLFCASDYLGLSQHVELRKAAATALERFGFGARAARMAGGTLKS